MKETEIDGLNVIKNFLLLTEEGKELYSFLEAAAKL